LQLRRARRRPSPLQAGAELRLQLFNQDCRDHVMALTDREMSDAGGSVSP
jgi:hypothetical protein